MAQNSGVDGRAGPGGGFFNNARNVVVYNPTMMYTIQGENDKVTHGEEHGIVPMVTKLFSCSHETTFPMHHPWRSA